MLSKQARKNNELKESLIELNVLDPEIFRKKKKQANFASFQSDICFNKTRVKQVAKTIDYNKLISFKYPKKVFEKFMDMLIYIPDIITEEDRSCEIVKKIKQDPFLHYSQPSLIDKSFSWGEFMQETNLECFNDEEVPIVKPEIPIFKNKLLKSTENSLLTSDMIEFEYTNEEQIKKMVSEKMKKMDLYNSILENSEEWAIKRKYKLTDKDIKKLVKLQQWVKSFIMRKRFIKSIWMNRLIEHKTNYLKLKRCLNHFDKKHKRSQAVVYYQKYVNVFKE